MAAKECNTCRHWSNGQCIAGRVCWTCNDKRKNLWESSFGPGCKISLHIPEGSLITGSAMVERRGSTFVQVRYNVPAEFAKEHDLVYRDRMLDIRIQQGENDIGPEITSYANSEPGPG